MDKVLGFLKEGNAIEDVWDADSLLQAFYAWEYLNKHKKLTVPVILATHGILMKNRPLTENEKGQFRTEDVWIGGHKAKPAFVVPELMEQWVVNVNDAIVNGKNENKGFLEKLIKKQHVIFEGIHGFRDGNGRLGRLLMNWTRIKLGLTILIIYEAKKYDYYLWFS